MPDPSKPKTLYLANPYGFSSQQRQLLLPPIVAQLAAIGADVWEPFERNNQVDFSAPGWAYRVAQADVRDVAAADGIFAIVNGTPPDEGVMVELGIAIGLKKPVFLFRDDFRRCTDNEQYPLNLMLFASLPEVSWESYFYTSVDEISNPQKALSMWLNS
jgi:nucleoside 2-deoxyribosyltransferase